jgi:anti-anti-sigma factor
LKITVTDMTHGTVVRLDGVADVGTVGRLEMALLSIRARRLTLVILDLKDLTSISSLFIGALVALRRDLGRWGGCVRIRGASLPICEAFETAGLMDVFEFCDSVENV